MKDEINIQQVKKLTSQQVQNISLNIRKLRKQLNLTQMDLAVGIVCDKSFISNMECGIYNDISLLTLNKLSLFLDVTIIELISY